MRVNVAALVIGFMLAGNACAQDLCGNIRLSVSEQIECRGRFTNSLGEGDRARLQQEYEDRIRRANDQLITPPILRSPPPPRGTTLPNITPPTPPAPPSPPAPPTLPGSTDAAVSTPPLTTPPGDVAPRSAPPSGTGAVAPNMTPPNPTSAPLRPVTPLAPATPSPPPG